MTSLKSALIRINSSDRTTSSISTSDFNLNYIGVSALSKVVSIVVKHISFPNVFYNVRSFQNTFKFIVGGITKTVTLQEGNYSIDNFILKFNYALALVDPHIYSGYMTLF